MEYFSLSFLFVLLLPSYIQKLTVAKKALTFLIYCHYRKEIYAILPYILKWLLNMGTIGIDPT